jgi:putative intracellular protease/amidase
MIPNDTHLEIGSIIFDGMDQIDLTGPFEVLSRIPNSTYRLYGTTKSAARDIKGLKLIPDADLAAAPTLDVLHVPGGFGQEALMDDEAVLGWIRRQAVGARAVFSVCTGALLCGAAGLLKGRRATTHWASFHLLPLFGAVPVNERVVIDGNWVFAAGVTAGDRRRFAARRGTARRRSGPVDPASHGLCARTAVSQRHPGDRPAPNPGRGTESSGRNYRPARGDSPAHRRQARLAG